MKINSIKAKILITIIPMFLVAMAVLTIISYVTSQKTINNGIERQMNYKINEIIEIVDKNLEKHAAIPIGLSKIAQATGENLTNTQYEEILKNIVTSNKDTFGAGIYYEPYGYNKNVKFFGPYVYKDKENVVFTEEYATEEYNYPNQDWYKKGAQSNDKITWIDPFYDEMSKVTMVTTAVPFFNKDNKLLGIAAGDIDITNLQKVINEIKVGDTGKAILLDKTGRYIAGVDNSKIMKVKVSEDKDSGLQSLAANLLSGKDGNSQYSDGKGSYKIFYKTIPSTKWVVALTISNSELYAPVKALLIKLLTITLVAVILIIIATIVFSNYISKNIKKANNLSGEIASGNLNSYIEVSGKDEVAEMCGNLNGMSQKLKGVIGNFGSSLENVVATSEELTASADQTQIATEKIALSMQELAEKSNEQFATSDNAVKVVENISGKISDISENVKDVKSASKQAAENAEKGEESITKVKFQINTIDKNVSTSSKIINKLGNKSNEIGEIVSLITNISTQTNLLSLNAAIEAARAGEHGKGFSIVADEVRKLAVQSGEAAENISRLILEIQSEISTAVDIMQEGTMSVKNGINVVSEAETSFIDISKSVDTVTVKISDVADVITEINSATYEMVKMIENISEISQSNNNNTQDVAAAAEEQNALMEEIAKAAEGLSDIAINLQQGISFFKY